MKKQVSFFLLLLTCFTMRGIVKDTADDFEDDSANYFDSAIIAPQRNSSMTSYILRLRFPASMKVPTLCGYYKGYRLSFNTDFCLINEKTPSDVFTLVICDELHRRLQNNATVDLKRTGKKCKMFYITKKYESGGQFCWDVEEENESNIPVILPKTAIIILLDPDLVKEVKKNDSLMKMKSSFQHPLHLPIIDIKPNVTEAQLRQACASAWCSAIDTRGVHSPVSSSIKQDSTMIVAMNTLER